MSHRDGIGEKTKYLHRYIFYVTKFSQALCRVQVNSVVHEFHHRSFVFSQSSCEVSASRTDVLTLKKSMADSLDNYFYCLGSERFGLWVQVYLGSSWLVLPLPYSGMTLSLLVPALQTGHPGLLGHVSSHWKTKKEYIMSSVNQKPICCREIKKDGEFWTWSLLIRWRVCCELSFCQINHYVLWISVVAHYTVKSEGLWFKFLKRNSDFSLYHILRHIFIMNSSQVVKMSVTTTDNSPSQDNTHLDDQTTL